jgi:biopolymer transport protein TolR
MASSFDRKPGWSMMSEINVTPMVDVMLVLLIIFMVAAPMMTQGLDVELPKVDAQAMRVDQDMVVLTVTAEGGLLLDDTPLAGVGNLDAQIRAVMKAKNTESVFLRADRSVPYGRVASVMGALRVAGITNIGLVTEPGSEAEDALFQAPAQPQAQAQPPGQFPVAAVPRPPRP